ncbi:hypothetical protein H2200_000687 [Cladophialophora chaetospira]|uniref:Xylanolytic transcriptional activator regulatory domain-containing protein n=1 Tax=Cladophialophora chaetospira TaxID=386627 RepID=A0AA38XP10_9EURO|nr:hypothetical protein H2200_000687 [Cladophialophora chaetospira]
MIIQELCNIFFCEANWYFSAIDKFYFDQAHRHWLRSWDPSPTAVGQQASANSLCFPALLFQVLAIAVQFVPPNSAVEETTRRPNAPSLDELSKLFSDNGERVLGTIGRHVQALTAVQADLMRCAWLKNCGRGSESWYALGNAVRQAQDQRLHLEPSPWQTTDQKEELERAWYHEHRRRLWATLFTWESHMALQLGRPRMINAADCTVKTPIDSDFPEHPSRTILATPATNEKPSFYTSSLVKHYFAQHIHKLMSLGALKPGFGDYSTIQSVHAEISQFLNGLPSTMRPDGPDRSWDSQYPDFVKHRLNISIVSNSFLLALHKPHVVQHVQSSELAVSAAIGVLNDTQLLFEETNPHQYKIYTVCFYLVDAGLLLAAMLARLPGLDQIKSHAITTLQRAVLTLSKLKEKNHVAVAGEAALQHCLQRLGCSAKITEVEQQHTDDHLPTTVATRIETAGQYEGSLPAVDESALITPASSVPQTQPESAFDQWRLEGPDIFGQIMDDEAWTASWLEQMNSISSMSFDFDEDGLEWNTGSSTALSA